MRISYTLAAAVVVVGALTGCVNSYGPVAIAEASDELQIGLTEWAIITGSAQAAVGEVDILVTNVGATAHDLVVHGSLGSWATPILAPSEQYRLRIHTEAGKQLELDCTLTGHHAQGMYAEVPVAPE